MTDSCQSEQSVQNTRAADQRERERERGGTSGRTAVVDRHPLSLCRPHSVELMSLTSFIYVQPINNLDNKREERPGRRERQEGKGRKR